MPAAGRVARTSLIPTSKTERAVQLIRERGTMRSDEIEQALGIESAAALLAARVLAGDLVTCKVSVAGKRHPLNEYRISAAAGMPRIGTSPWRGDRADKAAGRVLFKPETTYGTEPAPGGVSHDLVRQVGVVQPEHKAEEPIAGNKFVGEIETGVPVPPQGRRDSALREALSRLRPGDSFRTAYSPKTAHKMAAGVGIKVVTRREGEGIRIWRRE